MLGSMLVFGIVAAPDVAADHAEPEMHPRVAKLKAFLASFGRARRHVAKLIKMRARGSHERPPIRA
jgi:hypothetical protein